MGWGESVLKNIDIIVFDNGNLANFEQACLISVCSCYLPTRHNRRIIFEPYSPHLFGKRFGYCQDVLGTIQRDFCGGLFDDLLRFWRLCTFSNSKCKLTYLVRSYDLINLAVVEYIVWWTHIHDIGYLEHHIDKLIFNTNNSTLN